MTLDTISIYTLSVFTDLKFLYFPYFNTCNSSCPSLIYPDVSKACSPTDKANLFGSYFSTNSSLSDSNALDPPTQPLSNPKPSIIISARKVRRVLRSLKTDKASGSDGISPRFLKEFADEMAPVLCRLFRLILISCTYPSFWKHALFHPVPKKGDCSNPSNYCPIALTSAVAKVFETLLNSHFIKHLESNNLLSDHQYGFRKARSAGDLLSYLTHPWSSSLRNFGESFVVALDISKAFDRVWHKALLLAKLPAYGFTPSFCKLISSFLSNHFKTLVVDGATSASFPVSSGVPQGSVLSPTFLFFINDLLLPLMFIPLPMIQPYINLLPPIASLPLMLILNLVLLCLQLLTQICRAFPSGEPVI